MVVGVDVDELMCVCVCVCAYDCGCHCAYVCMCIKVLAVSFSECLPAPGAFLSGFSLVFLPSGLLSPSSGILTLGLQFLVPRMVRVSDLLQH